MVCMEKKPIGEITHFFSKINVAVIKLDDELKVGDTISIEGATTNFQQKVESMQVEHNNIEKAEKGMEVGLKVSDAVRVGDKVLKVEE
ncbi:MAG TPA: translation elongation factor-like protein [Candidatus Woesearchaeota archaeon]|nr:MAG: translation elongation factor-like protein [Candidatus Woesearchaeota archaeon]HDD70566.1 translation elongation factor-like protein [Candidatus Woesearchaeota archaeon]